MRAPNSSCEDRFNPHSHTHILTANREYTVCFCCKVPLGELRLNCDAANLPVFINADFPE